jgi:fructosamine-3-kinase
MNADITGLTPLSGGSISRAWKAETTAGALLVKTGAPSDLPMFEKEAEGLNEIAATRTIPVPQVYGCGMVETISYIVMTFVQGDEASDTAERLGRGVAAMHAVTGDRFGFRHDNFIGRLPQPNGWCADWTTFLRDRRLGFQLEMAIRRGHMPVGRRKRMERLLANLERWDPQGRRPVPAARRPVGRQLGGRSRGTASFDRSGRVLRRRRNGVGVHRAVRRVSRPFLRRLP